MDLETLYVRAEGGVATITLNQPERQNATTPAAVEDLGSAFDWIQRSGARVVVVAAEGRAFIDKRAPVFRGRRC